MPASKPSRSSIIQRPKLHEGVWFYTPPGGDVNSVVALVGQSAHALDPILYEHLIPLLDGSLTTDEIVLRLGDEIAPKKVTSCLENLAKRRVIFDAAQNVSARNLKELTVGVQALGGLSADVLLEVLQRLGVQLVSDPAEADFNVVLTDHYLRPELDAVNQSARQPWLMLGPNGHDMWIGPLFVPGETACWECLSHRLRLNRKVEQHIWLQAGAAQIPPGQSELASSVASIAFEVAAAQIVAWNENPAAPIFREKLSVLDSAKLEMTHHAVRRRPQCSCCGSTLVPDAQPVRLTPSPKMQLLDAETSTMNGRRAEVHRNIDAKATLKRYADHISPITGLVPALTNTSNAPGIHIFRGGRYAAETSETWNQLQTDLEYHAAGKGVTEAQAKVSALAETLEWYTLGAPSNCQLVQESFTRLSALERVLPPENLALFSADQLAAAQSAISSGAKPPSHVPEPFDPNVVIDWRPVWSLSAEAWVYVPAAFCSGASNSPYIFSNSNGMAAGTSLEDAIIHGFVTIFFVSCHPVNPIFI